MAEPELDNAPDLEPLKPRPRLKDAAKRSTPRRSIKNEKLKKEKVERPTDADTQPTEVTTDGGKSFTVFDGGKALMDTMKTIHAAKGNECCAIMYEQQKVPVALALNELAKDSPLIQSWIMQGRAFKFLALAFALQPIAAHSYLGHIKPGVEARRAMQEEQIFGPDQVSDDDLADLIAEEAANQQPPATANPQQAPYNGVPLRNVDIPAR
jgi:hypothetical protein